MSYIGELPAKLYGRAAGLAGILRDVIRIGQYELGEPFIWSAGLETAVAETRNLTVNVPADGIVACFRWAVASRAEGNPVNAFVQSISLGAQEYYRNVTGTVLASETTLGVAPQENLLRLPNASQGFLRRFVAYQNSSFIFQCVNLGNDSVRFTFMIEQYAIPNYVARRLQHGGLA